MADEESRHAEEGQTLYLSELEGGGVFIAVVAPKIGMPVTEEQEGQKKEETYP